MTSGRPRSVTAGLGVWVALASIACARDFDEPFAESTQSGGASGGHAGAGASGVSSGAASGECGAGMVCAPAVPAGWIGPLAYYEGAPSAAPPTCAAAALVDGFAGALVAPLAMCSACSCGGVQGVSCGNVPVDFFDTCASTTIIKNLGSVGTTCAPIGTPPAGLTDGDAGLIPRKPDVQGQGSCSPQGGAATLPPVSWASAVRVCAPDAAASQCSAGQCIAAPAAPFEATPCITLQGSQPCPDGPYSVRTVIYDSVDDQRSCTACACATSTDVECSAVVHAYSDSACSNDAVVASSGTCTAMSSNVASVELVSKSVSGTCKPSGGVAIGMVSPAGPWTVCCAAN